MGEVHRAVDTRKDRRLGALKRLPAGLGEDAEFQRRFRREAELVGRLREPHVIPIHDYGEIDGRPYLDMRLVEGTDAARLLDEHGPASPVRAVDVIGQVGQALDGAHREGLVHRDIKPGNVLLSTPESADASGSGPPCRVTITSTKPSSILCSSESSKGSRSPVPRDSSTAPRQAPMAAAQRPRSGRRSPNPVPVDGRATGRLAGRPKSSVRSQ